MKTKKILSTLLLTALTSVSINAQHQFTVSTKPGATIQPTMYGIFFEDINFAVPMAAFMPRWWRTVHLSFPTD